jgi:YugN-like family
MIPIESKLESNEKEFTEVKELLEAYQFSLGGNWDYDHGYFDRALDDVHKVWLRMPFDVINGSIDMDTQDIDAKIRMKQPFVLKHVYNEGLDSGAYFKSLGGLVDQFQNPVDPDGTVEPQWVERAKEVLGEVEKRLLQ